MWSSSLPSPKHCLPLCPLFALTPAPSVLLRPCPLHFPLFPTQKCTGVAAWHQGLCGRVPWAPSFCSLCPCVFRVIGHPRAHSPLWFTDVAHIQFRLIHSLKQPLQQTKSSVQVLQCLVFSHSNPCSLCLRDSVLDWSTGRVGDSRPARKQQPLNPEHIAGLTWGPRTPGPLCSCPGL